MNHLVTWQIHVDAKDPEEAARKALKIMRKKDSIATAFNVKRGINSRSVLPVNVDLQ